MCPSPYSLHCCLFSFSPHFILKFQCTASPLFIYNNLFYFSLPSTTETHAQPCWLLISLFIKSEVGNNVNGWENKKNEQKKETLQFTDKSIELENFILSKVTQTQKDKYGVLTYTWMIIIKVLDKQNRIHKTTELGLE